MNSCDHARFGASVGVRSAGGAERGCVDVRLAERVRRRLTAVWLRYLGVAVALMVSIGLGACGANGDPGTDSTTHFWGTCDTNEDCGSGGDCICGRCTSACDDDDECSIGDAQCVNSSLVLECEQATQICVPESVLLAGAFLFADASVPGATTHDASVLPNSDSSGNDVEAGTTAPTSAAATHTTNERSDMPTGERTDVTATSFDGTDVTASVDDGFQTTFESTSAAGMPSNDGETTSVAPPLLTDYTTAGSLWSSWRGDRLQADTGCQVVAFVAEANSCSYAVGCNEHSYQVACNEFGGLWDCGCSYPEMTSLAGLTYFGTSAADSSTACEATFQACTTPAEKYDCTVTPISTESTEYSCQWQQRCTIGVGGSDAEVSDGNYTGHCTAGDGFSLCSCEGPNWDRTYVIEEVASSQACDVARQACRTAPDPVTWEKPSCVDDVRVEGDQCEVERSCPLVAELSSQVTALSKLRSSSWCTLDGANQLCSCENENGRLHWVTPPGGTEECLSALDVCQRSSEIEFEGGPLCRSTSGMDELDACSRKERCVSSGTFDDELMTFIMDIEVGCSRSNDADDWSCSCTAGSRNVTATRNGSVNVADACSQQLSDCRPLVEFGLDAIEVP